MEHMMDKPVMGILPLYPLGTNSTFFTECCTVAICDDEQNCPSCGKKVIGWDVTPDHDRHRIRWRHAYAAAGFSTNKPKDRSEY